MKNKHNVKEMILAMRKDYEKIITEGHTHEDYLLHIFNALGTSKNEKFAAYIDGIRREWETGKTKFTPESLFKEVTTVYQNMVTLKEWNKQDPRDAKIVALTTSLKEVKEQLALTTTKSDKSNNSNGNSHQNADGSPTIEAWRKVKDGDSKTVKGQTWYWCPKHNKNAQGKYQGLYVKHKPENHDAWYQKTYGNKKDKKEKANAASDKSTTVNPKSKLQLSNKMKSVLTSKLNISGKEATSLWKECLDADDDEASK